MAEQNFEKAMTELEELVAKLEKGGLSLNDSLTFFEKGVKLARYLRGELEKAEKKTEILLKDEQGEIKAKPFELSSNENQDTVRGEKEQDGENSTGDADDSDLPF